MGNQLFDYCIGKVLASRTGLDYEPPPHFLTKRGKRLEWTGAPLFRLTPSPGDRPPDTNPIRLRCGHWLDLPSLDHATSIHLQAGYYQHYCFYRPYKDQIKNDWLKLQVPFCETNPQAVYCHLRRTDYVGVRNKQAAGVATTLDELKRSLDHFGDATEMIVCTDDTTDPWFAQLDQLGLPWRFSGGTWDQDLLTLLSADQLLIAQSTYSWWAGLLGRAKRIVCPLTPGTLWWYGRESGSPPTRGDYPNLIVDDEPEKWTWLP
jgi:hypothetical protein